MSETNGHKPRREKRSYTDRDKAAALVALDANGGNEAQTARQLKIPRKTLAEWESGRRPVNDDVANLRQEEKTSLADLFEQVIIAGLQAKLRTPENLSGIDIGIFADKMNVLRGAPDSISQNLNADPEKRKARILQLVTKAQRESA